MARVQGSPFWRARAVFATAMTVAVISAGVPANAAHDEYARPPDVTFSLPAPTWVAFLVNSPPGGELRVEVGYQSAGSVARSAGLVWRDDVSRDVGYDVIGYMRGPLHQTSVVSSGATGDVQLEIPTGRTPADRSRASMNITYQNLPDRPWRFVVASAGHPLKGGEGTSFVNLWFSHGSEMGNHTTGTRVDYATSLGGDWNDVATARTTVWMNTVTATALAEYGFEAQNRSYYHVSFVDHWVCNFEGPEEEQHPLTIAGWARWRRATTWNGEPGLRAFECAAGLNTDIYVRPPGPDFGAAAYGAEFLAADVVLPSP